MSSACRDCGAPIEWAYEPHSQTWLRLDAQVVDADDPAAWLVRRVLYRQDAFRLDALTARVAAIKGIDQAAARAQVVDLYPAHYDHRQTCPVRQYRQDRR